MWDDVSHVSVASLNKIIPSNGAVKTKVGVNLRETKTVAYPLENVLWKTEFATALLPPYFTVLEMSFTKSYFRQKRCFSRDSLILRPAERSGRAHILQGSRS